MRIISARHATPNERRQYESNIYRIQESRDMKDEYDFSDAERGKFHRQGGKFNFPLYLDMELLNHLSALAEKRGVDVHDLATELLKQDIKELEAD